MSSSQSKSNAEQVREFTEGSNGIQCPNEPNPMTKDEVSFVIRMVLSELVELAQTVCPTDEEAIKFLEDRIRTDITPHERTDDPLELSAHQADAAVDAMYYMYNCYAKKGINLSAVFDLVHQANMNKRDPTTGKFIRRQTDGKVIKPPNWTPPNILDEIKRQKLEGSWD